MNQITGTIMTCLSLSAVDGDTVKCDGVNLRPMGPGAPFVSGFDTPETFRPRCNREAALGHRATERMAELISTPGLQVVDSGEHDGTRSRRPLVWLVLPNGETIGEVLLREGHALEWKPGHRNSWC